MKQMSSVFCIHHRPFKISLYIYVNINVAKSKGKLKLHTCLDISSLDKGCSACMYVLHYSLDLFQKTNQKKIFKVIMGNCSDNYFNK